MNAADLKKIKRLAESGSKDEALEACDALLNKAGPETDLLRTRAYVLLLRGDFEQSLRDRTEVLHAADARNGDYFLAGQCALSAGRFSEAELRFNELLTREDRDGSNYFRAGALFLLAYAQMELRRYEEAVQSLDSALTLEPGCKAPVPGDVLWSGERLRQEISRRK